MEPASFRTGAAACGRCGYANAPSWPACIACGRSLRRATAGGDRPSIAASWPATRLVPACASAAMAFAVLSTEPQRTELLLIAGITTTVTLAALGLDRPSLPRPATVPVVTPAAPRRAERRADRLSDDDLRAALAAW
jgi:hypothetical protein